jgi:PAS domain S-box-containing protein
MENPEDKIKQLEQQLSVLKAQAERTAVLQAEKDKLDDEYRRSQNRYKIVFEKSAVGNKIIDEQLKIIKVNAALLKIMGYTEEEMLGRLITSFAHPDFVAHWKSLQHELWAARVPSFNFDTCLIRKDGAIVWVHITTIQIEDDGRVLGYTILEDISVRKEIQRLKDEVKARENRQQLVETILNTREEEQKRIAESLHNGLGQLLFGVKLGLGQLQVSPENEKALKYTNELITDCIRECRRISHNLMPAVLEEFGLRAAVETICRQLTNEVTFNYSVKGFTRRIDKFLEVAVYRMIQELMMNVVKHAGATRAEVKLIEGKNTIQISVSDNGKGIILTLLNGTLDISAENGQGTTFKINIPKKVD